MTEPQIKINGFDLTEAQATTIRVAVANFMTMLDDPEMLELLGEIGLLYRARLREIEVVMGVRSSLETLKRRQEIFQSVKGVDIGTGMPTHGPWADPPESEDARVVATFRGDCGIVHASIEEWQDCRVCDATLRRRMIQDARDAR